MSEIGHYMEACGRLSREVTQLKAELDRRTAAEAQAVEALELAAKAAFDAIKKARALLSGDRPGEEGE